MPEWLDITVIVALLGTIGGWIGWGITARKNRADTKLQAEKNKTDAVATIHEAYNDLCVELRGRITQLHTDIDRAVERITQLEQQNRELRKENEKLADKICDLEDSLATSERERNRLQAEVDELSTRLAKYESRPERNPRTRTVR